MQFPLANERALAAFQGKPDRIQQGVLAERFCQEFNSSGLHRPNRHGHVAVAGDENDRHIGSLYSDTLLQFQTIETWKRNVQY